MRSFIIPRMQGLVVARGRVVTFYAEDWRSRGGNLDLWIKPYSPDVEAAARDAFLDQSVSVSRDVCAVERWRTLAPAVRITTGLVFRGSFQDTVARLLAKALPVWEVRRPDIGFDQICLEETDPLQFVDTPTGPIPYRDEAERRINEKLRRLMK